MNRHTIAAAACGVIAGALALPACAQTTVQIYGVVDTSISYLTNVDAAGHSVTRMNSVTGELPSRIGFRGTEDLGNGLQAFFVLENGLSLDTGMTGQGNRLFGRAAQLGLKGAWGTLTLGRQLNMTYIAPQKADVLGPSLFALGSIDAYLPNARSDNAIGYMGNFGALVVGATYSFGRDGSSAGGPPATNCPGEVPGNARACRQYTGLVGWETKGWGVTTSYDRMYGNTGAGGGLTSSANTDTRATLNGYAMLGTVKLGAGVIDRDLKAATGRTESDLYYFGASYPFGAFTLDGQWAKRVTRHADLDATMLVARLTYGLSKRTFVYTGVGRMTNDGTSAVPLDASGSVGPGKTQNGVMAGLRHHF